MEEADIRRLLSFGCRIVPRLKTSNFFHIFMSFLFASVLPRATLFYDVVSFLYNGLREMPERLQHQLQALLIKPVTEDVQLEHIRIISEIRSV